MKLKRIFGCILLLVSAIASVLLFQQGRLLYTVARLDLLTDHISVAQPTNVQLLLVQLITILLFAAIALVRESIRAKRERTPAAEEFRPTSLTTIILSAVLFMLPLVGVGLVLHFVIAALQGRFAPPQPVTLLTEPAILGIAFVGFRLLIPFNLRAPSVRLLRGQSVIKDPHHGARTLQHISRKYSDDGIHVHPDVRVSKSLERKHFLYCGSSGSGKGQALSRLIGNILQRGDAAVLYDFKGDYTSAFADRDDVVLVSPFDERSFIWDVAADIPTQHLAEEFIAKLIPSPSSQAKFFTDAARDLTAGVITSLIAEKPGTWNLRDVADILSDPARTVDACRRYRPAALTVLGDDAKAQYAGVIASVRTTTAQLTRLSRAWSNDNPKFSFREWAADEENRNHNRVVIIRGHPEYPELDSAFIGCVFNTLVGRILSLPDCHKRSLWIVLDEFGNLPKIDRFDTLLATMRSKGSRFVGAIQSVAQLDSLYGKDSRDKIMEQIGTHLVGVSGHATAKFYADLFGRNQVETRVFGRSISRSPRGRGNSRSQNETQSVTEEYAVSQAEITSIEPPFLIHPEGWMQKVQKRLGLKTFSLPARMWLRIEGRPIIPLLFPIKPLPSAAPSLVPARWLTESPPASPPPEATDPIPKKQHQTAPKLETIPDEEPTLDQISLESSSEIGSGDLYAE